MRKTCLPGPSTSRWTSRIVNEAVRPFVHYVIEGGSESLSFWVWGSKPPSSKANWARFHPTVNMKRGCSPPQGLKSIFSENGHICTLLTTHHFHFMRAGSASPSDPTRSADPANPSPIQPVGWPSFDPVPPSFPPSFRPLGFNKLCYQTVA